jgi:hypothetical protein
VKKRNQVSTENKDKQAGRTHILLIAKRGINQDIEGKNVSS